MLRSSRCWASYRKDCSDDRSDEHLLSKALFPENIVYVSGFDWCKNEQRRIGVNSLTRKFLCVRHNNALSDADKEGVKALKLFRHEVPPSKFENGKLDNVLRGHLLEKWLLKTAINLSIGCAQHIGAGMADSEKGHPSPYLLAVAFGDLNFTHGMGAYFLYPDGYYPYVPSEIVFAPLLQGECIGGFYFGLRGQSVLLNLIPGTSPETFPEVNSLDIPIQMHRARLEYRPDSLATVFQDDRMSLVKIRW